MTRNSMKLTLLLLASVGIQVTSAQVKPLTDDHYFKNNFQGITNPLPKVTQWNNGSTFTLIKDGKTYSVDAKSGKESLVESVPVPEKTTPFIKDNDVFIKRNGQEIRLTNDKETENNPTVSPDGNYVAYTRKNDLYTTEISTKKETRLTTDGSDVILNGYASWVYMEEILGRASNYRAFWWSPNSRSIAFFRSDDTEVPVFTMTDANGQHGYIESVRYPKVGDRNPEVRIGIVSPSGGSIVWADFNPKDDQYFGQPIWKPAGDALLVQWLNRKQNLLKIWSIDPATGGRKPFYTEEQKTWVDLDGDNRITFLENNKGLVLQSDASGWNHLYLHDMDGNLENQVTSGKFTVTEINYIDNKKGIIYFTARKENSARKDLYSVNLKGKDLKRLTFGDFNHAVNLSPDGSYFVTTYSNVSTPARMALLDNKGKLIKELGSAIGPEFNDYRLAKTEMIRVKSDDGLYDLPMKITWPAMMEEGKKYPVLISIYGGPNSTGVNDIYALNGNQQFWAKEGLIQVSMDHRGSGHFGKEGASHLYHNLGYWEMKDYTTMVNWLIKNANADPSKIAITGFSYGGYVTAYALTYGADVFTHGMAGGSVTDWSLYDTHYTERYMGTMEDNADGYKKSNVMNYVDRYKGKLQIVHGIIDENVHMQNSIKLISALQDKKKDFEMMIYSGGRHGWGGAKGLHFQNLKTRFIYEHLLERDVPKGILK